MLKKILTIIISIVLSVVILFLLFSGLIYFKTRQIQKQYEIKMEQGQKEFEKYGDSFKDVTNKLIDNVSKDSGNLVG